MVIDFVRKQKFQQTNQINKNISKHERKGLMELKKTTKIKEVDKGGCVVIMSTKHYCEMVCDRLNDNQIYKKNW